MAEELPPTTPPPRGADLGWLLVIVYTAALVRVYPAYSYVFGGPSVVFQGNDAWYHLRLIDHLVQNFPHRITFDPYALFPGGQQVSVAPFLDLLIAGVAWMLGLGTPSERLVETVAAWFPPILGALTVLPVYGIGRRLFGRRAGLLAAGLLAVQPGQFLLRSVLGFVDHHVAEAFFSTLMMWLTVAALDRGRTASGWPLWRAAALAGLALGAYLLSWGSGSLFVAVLVLWLVVQALFDHLRGRPDLDLIQVALPMALVALVFLTPFAGILPRFTLHAAALAALAVAPLPLRFLSRLVERLGWPRPVFPLVLLALSAVTWLLLRGLWPPLAEQIVAHLGRFLPSELRLTVSEAQPLLATGEPPFEEVWRQYRAAFVLGLVGLATLLWRLARQGARAGEVLLLVWSVAMFAATLGQNRFGYYLDINLCLLIGQLCALILGPASGGAMWRPWHKLARAVGALAIALVAFLPTLGPVIDIARSPRGPDAGWLETLRWMRDNTPEPFGF